MQLHPALFLPVAALLAMTACAGPAPTARVPGSPAPVSSASAPPPASISTAPADSVAQDHLMAQLGAAAGTAAASSMRFTIGAGSEARYRAREVLAGMSFPSEAVGTTSGVSGAILVDASGAVVPNESKITVDLRGLRSDESIRDNFIQQETLQTARFPSAEFVPSDLVVLSPLSASGQFSFELKGNLTVHGVARPVSWQGSATVAGQQLSGSATTQTKITDWGMQIPRVFRVLSIEDDIALEMELRGSLSS